jgi:hypothetical protein
VPRTPVSIYFSRPCWLFLQEAMERSPAALPDETRSALQAMPEIRSGPLYSELRFKIDVLRLQAHDLLVWLLATLAALPAGDPRREPCLRCLDDVGVALAQLRRL